MTLIGDLPHLAMLDDINKVRSFFENKTVVEELGENLSLKYLAKLCWKEQIIDYSDYLAL